MCVGRGRDKEDWRYKDSGKTELWVSEGSSEMAGVQSLWKSLPLWAEDLYDHRQALKISLKVENMG